MVLKVKLRRSFMCVTVSILDGNLTPFFKGIVSLRARDLWDIFVKGENHPNQKQCELKGYRTVPRLFSLSALLLSEHNPLRVLVYQLQKCTEKGDTGTDTLMLTQTLKTEQNNNLARNRWLFSQCFVMCSCSTIFEQ